jgi:hypothetical protein
VVSGCGLDDSGSGRSLLRYLFNVEWGSYCFCMCVKQISNANEMLKELLSKEREKRERFPFLLKEFPVPTRNSLESYI